MEKKKEIHVLVFGGGSVGALYSYLLSTSPLCKVHTTIVCRSNYPTVSTIGFTLTSILWGNHTFKPTKVYPSLEQIPDVTVYDYVLDTTKSHPSTFSSGKPPLAKLSGSLPEATPIILIQNGIDIEAPYHLAFPKNPIVSGIAYISISQPAHGQIRQEGKVSHLRIGPDHPLPEKEHEKIQFFGDVLGAACKVTVHRDIRYERWRKVAWNGSWNTICAATGLDTQSLISSSPEAKEMVVNLLREIVMTAEAMGVKMDPIDSLIEDHVGWTLKAPPIVPSMLQDARKGAQMEVEVLCENIWRAAEKVGVKTPNIKSIYTILAAMNWRFKNSTENAKPYIADTP
ncbi:6-phosphogluconate dehydrogenase C-terminal domain-like protein [Choiromyces venosus 120613-1]|uniref:6-phosphogluconate dehydrogenase C-terminal domain-like protein n=1 Tax=Choiromyces venosus 120613-1 TaxID=1336337 RepID=A0A3N4JHX1_9PEZI|nr:6-phosphogluconate dehydrogenase C-terminal domain-like protein [Choiromyces venosus 120613-1]